MSSQTPPSASNSHLAMKAELKGDHFRKPPHEDDHDFPGLKWYISHFATTCIFLSLCLYELLEGWTHLSLPLSNPGTQKIFVKLLINNTYIIICDVHTHLLFLIDY